MIVNFCLTLTSKEDCLLKLKSDWFRKKVNIFFSSHYCCSKYQFGFGLNNDNDKQSLRPQIKNLIVGFCDKIQIEVDKKLDWTLKDASIG